METEKQNNNRTAKEHNSGRREKEEDLPQKKNKEGRRTEWVSDFLLQSYLLKFVISSSLFSKSSLLCCKNFYCKIFFFFTKQNLLICFFVCVGIYLPSNFMLCFSFMYAHHMFDKMLLHILITMLFSYYTCC
jgi:hypothetical protein